MAYQGKPPRLNEIADIPSVFKYIGSFLKNAGPIKPMVYAYIIGVVNKQRKLGI